MRADASLVHGASAVAAVVRPQWLQRLACRRFLLAPSAVGAQASSGGSNPPTLQPVPRLSVLPSPCLS